MESLRGARKARPRPRESGHALWIRGARKGRSQGPSHLPQKGSAGPSRQAEGGRRGRASPGGPSEGGASTLPLQAPQGRLCLTHPFTEALPHLLPTMTVPESQRPRPVLRALLGLLQPPLPQSAPRWSLQGGGFAPSVPSSAAQAAPPPVVLQRGSRSPLPAAGRKGHALRQPHRSLSGQSLHSSDGEDRGCPGWDRPPEETPPHQQPPLLNA